MTVVAYISNDTASGIKVFQSCQGSYPESLIVCLLDGIYVERCGTILSGAVCYLSGASVYYADTACVSSYIYFTVVMNVYCLDVV